MADTPAEKERTPRERLQDYVAKFMDLRDRKASLHAELSAAETALENNARYTSNNEAALTELLTKLIRNGDIKSSGSISFPGSIVIVYSDNSGVLAYTLHRPVDSDHI